MSDKFTLTPSTSDVFESLVNKVVSQQLEPLRETIGTLQLLPPVD